MKILYLYSELMGYQIPIFKEYINKFNAEVHVIHWDKKKLTPYKPTPFNHLHFYDRSMFSLRNLKIFILNLKPNIVYISGTMDKGYLVSAIPLRRMGIPVISGIDSIWKNSIRQKFASIIFPTIRRLFFSHAWVAGPLQFEFAKKIGYKNSEIIYNCYSADLEIFNKAYENSNQKKKLKYPHRFLYAGRLESVKGLDLLVEAWKKLKGDKKDWELVIIGNGSLQNNLMSNSDITVLDFMRPEVLAKEIEDSGCFILPSRSEPWALVLQEFSAAGLPIICSDICGSVPLFVINGFNGFTFKVDDINDLKKKILNIVNSKDDDLILMSERSHIVGQRITPLISAASFMSVLY